MLRNTTNYLKMTDKLLKKKLAELQETLDMMRETTRQNHKRFYVNKFKIIEGMTDEEKKQIKKNIDHRNFLARERYKKNKDTREKQQKRSREAYQKKKITQSNSESIVA